MNNQHFFAQERTFSNAELGAIAALLLEHKDKVAIYTFSGPLGAGKTTLISTMLSLLGVTDPITSPTFTLLQSYSNAKGQQFYHFDLYRIETVEQFIHDGFQEYLYAPESWAFIEWPAVIMPLIHGRVCHVFLDYVTETERLIRFSIEL